VISIFLCYVDTHHLLVLGGCPLKGQGKEVSAGSRSGGCGGDECNITDEATSLEDFCTCRQISREGERGERERVREREQRMR